MSKKILKIALEFLKTLIIFLIIYTLLTLWRQPKPPANLVGNLIDMSGQTHDLVVLSQNKAVLIYFWASWCHVCKHTTPTVLDLADEYPVLAVAVQSGDDKQLGQFLNRYQRPAQFFVVNDELGTYFGAWQGQVTPSYVIVKDGQVVQQFVGIQPGVILRARMAWASL